MHLRKDNRTALILLFLIAASLVSYRAGYAFATDAINNATYQAGTQVSQATYTIFMNGITCYARNGITGAIDLQSTNETYVIQQAFYSMPNGGEITFIGSATYIIEHPIRMAPSAVSEGANIRVTGQKNVILKADKDFPVLTPGVPPMFYTPPSSHDYEICGLTFDTNVPESNNNTICIFIWGYTGSRNFNIHDNTHINANVTGLTDGQSVAFVQATGTTSYDLMQLSIHDNYQYLPEEDFHEGSCLANLVRTSNAIVSGNVKTGIDTLVRVEESKGVNIENNVVLGLCVLADIQGSNIDINIIGNQQLDSNITLTPKPFGVFPVVYIKPLENGDKINNILIDGNIIEGGAGEATDIYGVYIINNTCTGILINAQISNNIFNATSGSLDIGVYITLSYTEVLGKITIINNQFNGIFGANIYNANSLSRNYLYIWGNVGWADTAYGLSTISSSTSVSVNCGLQYDVIIVTPLDAGYGTYDVLATGATTFDIRVTNSGSYDFYWYVIAANPDPA